MSIPGMFRVTSSIKTTAQRRYENYINAECRIWGAGNKRKAMRSDSEKY